MVEGGKTPVRTTAAINCLRLERYLLADRVIQAMHGFAERGSLCGASYSCFLESPVSKRIHRCNDGVNLRCKGTMTFW